MSHQTTTDGSNKALEEILSREISEKKCDILQLLNRPEFMNSPREAYQTVQNMLKERKEACAKNRNDLAIDMTLDKTAQLGPVIDTLNKRLQEHVRMLRQTESSTKQPNVVLEHDMAKRRADKLAEILRAKLVWNNTYEELQLLDTSDVALRYQKLVQLQQSYDILKKYSFDLTKKELFERMKDEFLSWYSPATILAIDSNDLKQLENIKEKYLNLDRIKVFEANFGNYARNKIKCLLEDESKQKSLWSILEELFGVWKRCHKIVDSFIDENGSELIAKHLYDGLMEKWDKILIIISETVSTSENPFIAAKSIGKVLNDFLDFVEREGDEYIFNTVTLISQSIYSVLSEDYGKYVTSMLLQTINKITAPEKSSRQKHDWLMPYFEDIQVMLRDIANEAKNTFGAGFPPQIIPSFEQGIREINSLLQNQDILNIKPEALDIRMKKGVQENTENKISAICITGYLINMVEDINNYILELASEFPTLHEPPRLISNSSLFETLNLKVVGRKIESIANTIVYPMNEEMTKLVQKHLEESDPRNSVMDSKDELALTLPTFSISPHNYAMGVGHGLLSQMNTISGYGNDRNFVRACISAANDTKSSFNEDEPDLWLLTEVAKLVQNAFCSNVGNVSQLPLGLKRQFKADILFLMDALADLRLQPTSQLLKLSSKLKGVS